MTALPTRDMPDPDPLVAAADLLDKALRLSEDLGAEVVEAVRRAATHPLDEQAARRLYRRVLGILRGETRADLDPTERRRLVNQLDAELAALLVSPARQESVTPDLPEPTPAVSAYDGDRDRHEVHLVERCGLTPHSVVPIPVFKGQPVPMEEGYVDITELRLWRDNARVKLNVEEFKERNGRLPEASELLQLMLDGGPASKRDPFKLRELADSIARRGVELPPVLDRHGVARDGNRRLAASMLIQLDPKFSRAQKERARWVRVWVVDPGTTADQIEAVVVARNFEAEYKEPWPEYIKARLVADSYESAVLAEAGGTARGAREKRIRDEVAEEFGITASAVKRYVQMVRWANDFEDYHRDQDRDPAEVRYKSNDIFQWFYEIDAGRGQEKLVHQLESDDDLRGVVYDLMFDVLDSGLQVRNLHRVVGQEEALALLNKAHVAYNKGDATEALDTVKDAVAEAQRRSPSRRALAFDKFAERVIERFGAAATDDWAMLDPRILRELRRVLTPALAAVESLLPSDDVDQTAGPDDGQAA